MIVSIWNYSNSYPISSSFDIWNKVFIRAPESITNVTLEVDDIQEDCIIYFINALNI